MPFDADEFFGRVLSVNTVGTATRTTYYGDFSLYVHPCPECLTTPLYTGRGEMFSSPGETYSCRCGLITVVGKEAYIQAISEWNEVVRRATKVTELNGLLKTFHKYSDQL